MIRYKGRDFFFRHIGKNMYEIIPIYGWVKELYSKEWIEKDNELSKELQKIVDMCDIKDYAGLEPEEFFNKLIGEIT